MANKLRGQRQSQYPLLCSIKGWTFDLVHLMLLFQEEIKAVISSKIVPAGVGLS